MHPTVAPPAPPPVKIKVETPPHQAAALPPETPVKKRPVKPLNPKSRGPGRS